MQMALAAVVVMANYLEHSVGEGQDDFNWLVSVHDSVCILHPYCSMGVLPTNASANSPCCGTCTCEPDCEKYGICCLGHYKNLSHARESTENNR